MKSNYLKDVLPKPNKPTLVPDNAKWLSGEGCGSWFHIEQSMENYLITRYSPEGKKECEGIFMLTNKRLFNIAEGFEITYLSHCAEVNVIQNKSNFKFSLIIKHNV